MKIKYTLSVITLSSAYPFDVPYDMNYGKATELPITTKQILKVPLPNTDPILGKDGPLFKYWQ